MRFIWLCTFVYERLNMPACGHSVKSLFDKHLSSLRNKIDIVEIKMNVFSLCYSLLLI